MTSPFDLTGKTAIVTGASSGIGQGSRSRLRLPVRGSRALRVDR